MKLSLPTTPSEFLEKAVIPGLALLPMRMNSMEARVMLVSIAQQESGLRHRFQVVQGQPGVKGVARGLLQFERGSKASRGGVWGVYLHSASSAHLQKVCEAMDIAFTPDGIYSAIEDDDVFAVVVGRLLLWTDGRPLPPVNDAGAAWDCYIRNWRPGQPHPAKWQAYHKAAQAACDRRK